MSKPLRCLLVALALSAAACSTGDSKQSPESGTTARSRDATTSTTERPGGMSTTTAAGSATSTSAPGTAGDGGGAGAAGTPEVTVEVVGTLPHRPDAFTQGLEWHEGVLYESTGLVGESTVAAVASDDGAVLRETDAPGSVFAEGLTRVGDRLIQLTWKDEVAFVYDLRTFDLVGEYTYGGEGWGLCFDGRRLVMSDGSSELTFRDPGSFDENGSVTVALDGSPVAQLNELECVGDRVYANVWHTDTIMEIDPGSGAVTRVIDASALRARLDPAPTDPEAVLNGIAHDAAAGTFWLTGKLWPQLFEVRLGSS